MRAPPLCLALCLAACGPSTTTATPPNYAARDARAAQLGTAAAHDAAGTDGPLSIGPQEPTAYLTDPAAGAGTDPNAVVPSNPTIPFTGAVEINGCQASLIGTLSYAGTTTTAAATLQVKPTTCTRAAELLVGDGDITSFAGSTTVALTADTSRAQQPRTLTLTQSYVAQLADGTGVLVGPPDAGPDRTAVVAATGLPGDGETSQSIALDVHHVHAEPSGSVRTEHLITTDPNAPVVIRAIYRRDTAVPAERSRVLDSGTVHVVNPQAGLTTELTYEGLSYDSTASCACPDAGRLAQVVTLPGGSYTRTYTFSGCGTATVTTTASTFGPVQNGTTSIAWQGCHG